MTDGEAMFDRIGAAGGGGTDAGAAQAANAIRPIIPVPKDAPALTWRHRKHGTPSRIWAYRLADGALAGHVARLDFTGSDGTPGKEVVPLCFCEIGGDRREWRQRGMPPPRPLYCLPELVASPSAAVLVVEGEKAADAASALFPDLAVTTSAAGARASDKSDWSPLDGRSVAIWPDHDADGAAYADSVARLARAAGAAHVGVVAVPSAFPAKWDLADALPDGWDLAGLRALIDTALAEPAPEAPSLPTGFYLTDSGLFSRGGDAADHPVHVCGPLRVLAKARDAASENWGALLHWRDDDGQEHHWCMPRSLLSSDGAEVRSHLQSGGLFVAPGQKARYLLMIYLSLAGADDRVRCVNRVGWHGRAFVLPDATFGATAGERVLLQTTGAGDHAFRTAGDLAGWQEAVAAACIGNSRLTFAISAAFAAPLLHLVNLEPGGFHLRGGSSTGKTTALLCAGSVWGGGGVRGYLRSWRTTDNALEGVALAHCDTLLCLDEMGEALPHALSAAAYMLANGTGKRRMTKNAEARPVSEFRTLFLSTGEIGLADKIAEDGRGRRAKAGQSVRVVDIPADAGAALGLFEVLHGSSDAGAFAERLRRAASEHYGTAARAFLAALVADPDRIASFVSDHVAEFVAENCPRGADGQVGRVVRRFALVSAAGELAIALGILPWSEGEANAGAARCFRDWLAERGGSGAAEIEQGIAAVRRFLELHGEARFAPWGGELQSTLGQEGGRVTVNRAGFRKAGADGMTEFFILPEVWRDEVLAGFDAQAIGRALAERGVLVRGEGGKLQSKPRLPGMGPSRCYLIASRIFNGGGDA